ncbi:MAG: monooxygenase [Nocardia sp.]|uniref:flavin-containing monooxygenase n=1 Tax=Nocardia sp. TaxID=1821 RepID=UPI0026272D55|nr:NAD(P)/FAD-dependent oxidoreductase [Nocardia sp.]MCU1646259.1 monooxygenase [Nocardia sp.]
MTNNEAAQRRMPSVAIIGAGMSGMCMAITLRKAGITDVTLYEKASEVGGTWRDNTYPGLSCDIPSRFYQYKFATNPVWSHLFSPGGEIQEYFTGVADTYDLRERIRFDTEIVDAVYENARWRIRTAAGEERVVDFLISAAGILREPRYPNIKGLGDFGGAVMHSARWDHSVETTGKRVAVIGTGSTGVQIVCGLAESVERLELFQRSAQWILPIPNPSYSSLTTLVHNRIPTLDRLAYVGYRNFFEFFAQALVRPGWKRTVISQLARTALRTVRDPELRLALTPDYEPMCRRLVISSGFYPAMQRDNVDLVTTGIDHIEERGIVTTDGRLHEFDVIALATGFDAHAFMRPMNLTGVDGRTVDEAWAEGPRGHLTVGLPGFPNFFMLMGPHSPVGNYALTAIAENQADHILGWIDGWRDGRFDSVAPTERATAAFNDEMRSAMPGTVWTTGCTSWYLGTDGLPELWPWTPDRFRARMAEPPRLADYHLNSVTDDRVLPVRTH